jgi:hypothetical protein
VARRTVGLVMEELGIDCRTAERATGFIALAYGPGTPRWKRWVDSFHRINGEGDIWGIGLDLLVSEVIGF